MTGEEGWSNPQIVVNGASIGAMERGATPNRRSLRVSRGGKGKKKILTPSPESHCTESHPPRGEHRRGEGRIATVVADRRREEGSRKGKVCSRMELGLKP